MQKKYSNMTQFMFLSFLKRIISIFSFREKGVFNLDNQGASKRKEPFSYSHKIAILSSALTQNSNKHLNKYDLLFTNWEDISKSIKWFVGDKRLYILLAQEFSKELCRELEDFIKKSFVKGQNLNFVVQINEKNALYGDDFALFFANYPSVKVYFDLDPKLNIPALSNELYFHITMFFEGLKKRLGKDYLEHYRLDSIFQLLQQSREKATPIPYTSIQTLPTFHSLREYMKRAIYSKKSQKNEVINSEMDPKETKILPSSWNRVLILGWYGTETQGDKAILGEVLHFLKMENEKVKITLSSIYTVLSEQTNLELIHLKDVDLIPIGLCANKTYLSQFDAIIIGGGPLMESSSMRHLANVFAVSNSLSIPRIVFGCGVGPIHSKKVESYTKTILKYSTGGFLRDAESKELADSIIKNNLGIACDPAMGFMVRWRKTQMKEVNKSGLACLLRANTNEFANDLTKYSLKEINKKKAAAISLELNKIVKVLKEPIQLLHMNAPWIGGDDRIFNRFVAEKLDDNVQYSLIRDYFTLEQHIEALAENKYSLAMRYHGHIFSIGLAIPFVSLDYTGKKGKVSSLMNRIGLKDLSIKWDEIDDDFLLKQFQFLEKHYEEIHESLLKEGDRLVDLLHDVYKSNLNAIKF